MAEIHGHCDPAFDKVREIFKQRITQGDELGASLCVNIDGRNVVDLWGGYADTARTRTWNEDTITVVWSCSKVVTTIAALILIDRGLLDPNENVSKYWPEFAANGKENVKVWHFLSHASGVPSWERPITMAEIYDTPKATEKLAKQAPWWTPGEKSGYHLFNFGHLIGELVRRISGKSLKQFIADEIAGPLGADFRLGVEEKDWPRTADISTPPVLKVSGLDPKSVAWRALAGSPVRAKDSMTPEFRKAEVGAANGFGNARALARIGSVVSLGGTVDGKHYFSSDVIKQMLSEQIKGEDLVLLLPSRFGWGVGLPMPQAIPWIPNGNIGFWGGWGGSIIVMDTDRRMAIGYAMNKMELGTLGNQNAAAYVKEIYKTVGGIGPSSSL